MKLVVSKLDELHDLRDAMAWAMIDDDRDLVEALRSQIGVKNAEIADEDGIAPVILDNGWGFDEIIPQIGNDKR